VRLPQRLRPPQPLRSESRQDCEKPGRIAVTGGHDAGRSEQGKTRDKDHAAGGEAGRGSGRRAQQRRDHALRRSVRDQGRPEQPVREREQRLPVV